jgi:arsenate reductase
VTVRPSAFVTQAPRRALFICIHNAARSQMAEGFARAVSPEGTEIWSAGTQVTAVHPLAIEVMKEVGIDITAQQSKALDSVPWQQSDTVISLCGESESVCPNVAGDVRRVHWPLPDPAAAPEDQRLAAFREVRDEIRWRVRSLWPPGD